MYFWLTSFFNSFFIKEVCPGLLHFEVVFSQGGCQRQGCEAESGEYEFVAEEGEDQAAEAGDSNVIVLANEMRLVSISAGVAPRSQVGASGFPFPLLVKEVFVLVVSEADKRVELGEQIPSDAGKTEKHQWTEVRYLSKAVEDAFLRFKHHHE